MNLVKELLDEAVKKGPEFIKKHAPKIALGGGSFALGAAWQKIKEKKAVDKAYKKGYSEASVIYEKKFKKLTEEFLSKEKTFIANKKEYDKLLLDYEKEIERLEKVAQKSKEEYEELSFLITKKKELQDLRIVS